MTSPALRPRTFELLSGRQADGPQPLKGKNLAVLCDTPDCGRITALVEAAASLGAQVTHIHPSSAQLLVPAQTRALALVLVGLYDAIECHGVPASVVAILRQSSTKPVYSDAGCCTLPAADHTQDALRAWLLQALA